MEHLLEWIVDLDRSLFLWLNGLHAPWMDPWMERATHEWFWIPLFGWWIYILVKENGRGSFYILLYIVVVLTLSDQLTSGLMKPFFERLRPSHEPAMEGLVHIVNNYRGGLYGFPSSHAANSVGVSTLLWGLRGKKLYGVTPFVWAALFTYTRIYLGVHYPLDVLVGALIGFLSSQLVLWAIRRWAHSRLAP